MNGNENFMRAMYPFLYPTAPTDAAAEALLASVRESTAQKCAEVVAIRNEMLDEYETSLERAAQQIATRIANGGMLLAFGNGGSATDADDACSDCVSPPHTHWREISAVSLPSDGATMSGIANDVGFDAVFARQLGALGGPNDIALGFTTSGNSSNIVTAFAEAKRRGMYTVAFVGYDGGLVARSNTVDACFIARREYVPRIQEGHATFWHVLLELVQDVLADQPQVVN